MTEQEVILRLHEKRKRGKELKKMIAALEDDLRERAKVWYDLGHMLGSQLSIVVGSDDSIRVYNPSRPVTPPRIPGVKPSREAHFEQIGAYKKSSFDGESLMSSLQQLYDAKNELAEVEKYCQEAGDPL